MVRTESPTFGELLRRSRRALGLTQEELAERAGVSARLISTLESGTSHRPRKDTIRLLAQALELPAEEQTAFMVAARPAGPAPTEEMCRDQGERAALPASSVQTFLVTDIRGYTRFTQSHGDEAAAQLAIRFAAAVEEAVRPWEGRIIETRGDEVLVAFSSARGALQAAVALQAELETARAADPSLSLAAGIGIDAGEAILVGAGYRGGALNLAARLCDLAGRNPAGGSEVFCSETVMNLAGRLEGLRYVERGEVQVKNLASPVRVIQVGREEELPAALPPLRQVSVSSPTNLPDEPTPFIGREREIAAVADLLERLSVRLVTLTGAGGTGKSRLALQVGRRLLGDFPDGVFFVSLAPLNSPELVPWTIAEALQVQETSGQPLLETLKSALRGQRSLLILDNFEHLLPAAAAVPELLEGCNWLRILVTSRQPLHLSWEHEYAVPPLEVPEAEPQPDLRRLGGYDAVALFLQRAEAVKAGFALTSENAQAVVDICRRVDGLPLAIELAAARIKLFPPQTLLTRLEHRMRVLTGGARDLPARQQTMRDTVAWSYGLLNEEEQALVRRLSVFMGGCTLEAVEAVCSEAGDRKAQVLPGLESLVDQSLLMVEEQDGEPRFRMLETVRDYALEQLTASREADQVWRRHAEAFLRLAEEAEREGSAAHDPVWLTRLEREIDNLRAALVWSLEQEGTGEMALRLAGALVWFWCERYYVGEGRRWLEQCLAVSTSSQAAERHPRAHAQVLTGIGRLASNQADLTAALSYAQQGVAVWRTLNDKRGLASALRTLGWVARKQGDHVQARSLLEEAAELSGAEGAVQDTIWALHGLASAEKQQGNLAAARSRFEEAVVLSMRSGRTLSLVHELCSLAEVAWAQGDAAAQRRFYEEALASARSVTEPAARFAPLNTLAWISCRLGNHEQAAELLTEGLTLARGQLKTGQDWWNVAWTLNHLGDVARFQRDVDRAASLYEESLSLFRQHGERQGIAAVLHNVAHEALLQGNANRARTLFMESLSLFRELNFAWGIADCVTGLAGVVGQEGRPERAALLYGAAEAAHQAVDASGTLIAPANQIAWEQEMAAARGKMDAETWEQAWSAGRAMSIDQALAYAPL